MSTAIAMGCLVVFVAWKEGDRHVMRESLRYFCMAAAVALLILRFKGAI